MPTLKKLQRQAILKVLKNDLTPSMREEQSKKLCERLYQRITKNSIRTGGRGGLGEDEGCPHMASIGNHTTSRVAATKSSMNCTGEPRQSALFWGTVHVCSFLPMYFEPDLLGLARGLWALNSQSSPPEASCGAKPTDCTFRMYAPRMATPDECKRLRVEETAKNNASSKSISDGPVDFLNIMHFVEFFSEEDLAESFAPQGKFKIMEIKPSVWDLECCRPTKPENVSNRDGMYDHARTCTGNTTDNTQRRRHVLGHAPPAPQPFAKCLASSGSQIHAIPSDGVDHHHLVVVLCPAAGFDSKCGRIGKGAGYYDRFLEGLSNALHSPPSIKKHSEEGTAAHERWSYTTIGVGFDEQVVSDLVVMEQHDAFMDEVITPSYHFTRHSE